MDGPGNAVSGPTTRPGPGRRPGADRGRPLNPWLEERLRRLASPGGAPVLDVGCGRGYWLGRMAEWGLPVVGVEYDRERAAVGALHRETSYFMQLWPKSQYVTTLKT